MVLFVPARPAHTWRWFPANVCYRSAIPPPSHSSPEGQRDEHVYTVKQKWKVYNVYHIHNIEKSAFFAIMKFKMKKNFNEKNK